MQYRSAISGLALAGLLAAAPAQASEPEGNGGIRAWLQAYDAAFNTRDVQRLTPFYHPDVTIFEGGSTNDGWADYRDHHLGPELKEMEGLQFSHFNVTPHVLGHDGRTAYVTAEYRIKARIDGRDVDAAGLETLVLVKDASGAWNIRHSHTSSRKRPAQAAPAPPPQP